MTASEYALFTASNSDENSPTSSAPDNPENTVILDLGDSSGSEEDLGLEAKRIMRDRRRENDRLKSLGNLVPLASSEESTSSQIPPLPLRRKRAEMSDAVF